jgi:4-hydroxy-2-oxoheptanedioate aldolase
MNMRPSRVLRKLRAGDVASCFKLNLTDNRAAEIAARSGFDCLWTDMEHTANDYSVIERQIIAAKCFDVDTVVRTTRGSYSDYIRPLELDAAGIMVPHIMSLEDARNVVRMSRFPPLGRRAVDRGNADGAYCNVPFVEYLNEANKERFVVLQIEDTEPLEELDAIAALDGYNILFFGPGDFSCAIGAPGEWDHPLLLDARRRIAAAAQRHGKFAGIVSSPENLTELVGEGYRFISVGADVVGLSRYCSQMVAGFQKVEKPQPR